MMKTIYIDYDDLRLKTISEKIYNLFIKNNYHAYILNNTLTNNEKINIIKETNNSFVISNKINDNNNTFEIIYPLRDNNDLSLLLSDNLSKIYTVTKYYQLRDNTNTNLDYYQLLRNINNSDGIVIKYGLNLINNDEIPSIIYQTISNYLGNENIYIVKSGDTLYAIAKKFNVSVDEIKKMNNLKNNNLSIGQNLIISKINTINNNNTSNDQSIYIVKSGDSLYSIAKRFNTTVDDIKKTNNLTSNLLSINQKLIIPSQNIYIVKSGDTLYSIAKKYNSTVENIKKINNLSNNNLSINQKLIIK